MDDPERCYGEGGGRGGSCLGTHVRIKDFKIEKKKNKKLNPVNVFTLAPGKMLVIISRGRWRDAAAAAAKSLVVSDSVRPHRRQPTRLRRPWDSPGKNTGVGCHCLLRLTFSGSCKVLRKCPEVYHRPANRMSRHLQPE